MAEAIPTEHLDRAGDAALSGRALTPDLVHEQEAQERADVASDTQEATVKLWPRFRRTSPMLKWLLLPLLFMALGLSLIYLARTRAVSGPTIQALIHAEANKRGIDLFIQDMRPSGLFGVRLDKVRARIKRGPYALDTRIATVEIEPDLWRSIQQRRVIPGTIHITDSDILIERRPDQEPPKDEAKAAAAKRHGGALAALGELHVIGHDVRLKLKAGRSFSSTRHLRMQRIEARIPLTQDPLPTTLQAYGTLPDQTPFSLSSAPDEATTGRRYILKPQHATKLHQWFTDQMPFEMTSQEIVVCSGCGTDEIALGEVQLKLPNFGKGFNILAQASKLQWDRGKATLLMPGVKVQGLKDSSASVELKRTHFMFDTATGSHTGELELTERSGGALDITWLWDGKSRQFSGALEAKRFSLSPFFALWEATPLLTQGTLDGSVSGVIDPRARQLQLHSDMALLDAMGHWPQLIKAPLKIAKLHLRGESLLDLNAQSVSLSDIELKVGENEPVHLWGTAQKLSLGYTFQANAWTKGLELEQLKRDLPPEVSGVFSDASFSGGLDLELSVAGHTEFPDALDLKIDAGGDLQIIKDGSRANLAAMSGHEMPWREPDRFDPPILAQDWVSIEALPAHVPRTITAAEDAQFYKHNGFDPFGFERAMAHNLRVKRMERGGSTITQQVVKNVFLSHERTVSRKLQEALLTWRAEQILGKDRILEIYLNIAHWGPGMRGLNQAALGYFGVPASELTVEQTAFLGAILPGPKLYGPQVKAGYIASSRVTKFEHIMANLRFLGLLDLDEYYKLVGRSLKGQLAGLELTICADDDSAPKGAISCKEIPQERL